MVRSCRHSARWQVRLDEAPGRAYQRCASDAKIGRHASGATLEPQQRRAANGRGAARQWARANARSASAAGANAFGPMAPRRPSRRESWCDHAGEQRLCEPGSLRRPSTLLYTQRAALGL